MLQANGEIMRQLQGTPAALRGASLTAGPNVVWSLSAWTSREALQAFMRDGAHGRLMWQITRWLDSFWLMRWEPREPERGSWDGLRVTDGHLASADGPAPAPGPAAADPAVVFAGVPPLRRAFGSGRSARYDAAPDVARRRRQVADAAGAVMSWDLRRLPRTAAGLRTLQAAVTADPQVLMSTWGLHRTGLSLFVVCRGRDPAARLLHLAEDATWATALQPLHEFGHWDGLRVRARVSAGRRGA